MNAVRRPAFLLRAHDAFDDTLDDDWIVGAIDRAALGSRQDEQVLDEPVEPIGLGLQILDQLAARIGGRALGRAARAAWHRRRSP